MRMKIGIGEVAGMLSALNHHQGILSYFPQLPADKDQKVKLRSFYDERLRDTKFDEWCDVDARFLKQTWGNTSRGWQGIGGAAISSGYTVVIENHWLHICFVYYSGELAYICEMDEKYHANYFKLPGYKNCKKELNIIYKK